MPCIEALVSKFGSTPAIVATYGDHRYLAGFLSRRAAAWLRRSTWN